MSSTERKVTIRDLAREYGVSVATVSRALRDDPRHSEGTRNAIKALARRRGYTPDPGLSALASYRSRIRPASAYGKLAVLVDTDRPEEKYPPMLKLNMEGLRIRARQLGYEMDLFLIKPEPAEQKRLSRILYSRGIRGVIFTAIRWVPTAFHWDHFSVVSIGENLTQVGLYNITYDHDWCISATYKLLREHGYRNIGFCNIIGSEARNRHLHLASYLKCLFLDGLECGPGRVYFYDDQSAWSPIPWLDANRFDAVMVPLPDEFLKRLEGTRYTVPDQLGVMGFILQSATFHSSISTLVGDPFRQAMMAVGLLHALIQENKRGIPKPDQYYSISIKGSSHQGSTIRKVSEIAPPLPIY